MLVTTGILATMLALIHVVGWRLRFLDVIPRSRWLSAGSGISVGYVFVHILPQLAESQDTLQVSAQLLVRFAEHHVYLLAMLGMIVFYGLERMVKQSREDEHQASNAPPTHDAPQIDPQKPAPSAGVFWVHVASFFCYNALIGYLLIHRERPGVASLLLYFVAMAMHFLVNDYGLRQDHKQRYDHLGRWLLAGAILTGWLVGLTIEIHQAAIAVLFSFLAGSVMLNVLKEELPEQRQSNFWAFAIGAAAYASLLLIT